MEIIENEPYEISNDYCSDKENENFVFKFSYYIFTIFQKELETYFGSHEAPANHVIDVVFNTINSFSLLSQKLMLAIFKKESLKINHENYKQTLLDLITTSIETALLDYKEQ